MSASRTMSVPKKLTVKDAAFVRGYVAACAELTRHHVGVEELLRAANITRGLLARANVDAYDRDDIRPVLKRIADRERDNREIARRRSKKQRRRKLKRT